MRMGLLHPDGPAAPFQRLGLQEVRGVPAVRDQRRRQPNLRRVPDVHKRRGVPDPHGVLPEDVLCHSRLPGVELERFEDREAHGVASVHRLLVLVAHSLLLPDGSVRTAADNARTSQSIHGVRASVELVL